VGTLQPLGICRTSKANMLIKMGSVQTIPRDRYMNTTPTRSTRKECRTIPVRVLEKIEWVRSVRCCSAFHFWQTSRLRFSTNRRWYSGLSVYCDERLAPLAAVCTAGAWWYHSLTIPLRYVSAIIPKNVCICNMFHFYVIKVNPTFSVPFIVIYIRHKNQQIAHLLR